MADLVKLTERLNRLTRRKLEIEAAVKMVDLSTSTERVRALKHEHARCDQAIERLERRLK
jgi:primosomal protein N''